MSSDYPKWDYKEYPKSLDRDDFWGQVTFLTMYSIHVCGSMPSSRELLMLSLDMSTLVTPSLDRAKAATIGYVSTFG